MEPRVWLKACPAGSCRARESDPDVATPSHIPDASLICALQQVKGTSKERLQALSQSNDVEGSASFFASWMYAVAFATTVYCSLMCTLQSADYALACLHQVTQAHHTSRNRKHIGFGKYGRKLGFSTPRRGSGFHS